MGDHEPAVRLRVLGPTRLERDGEPVPIRSLAQRRILAALAAADGRSVDPDVLVDVVWGDRLPASPAGALQTQLTRARQLLGGPGGRVRRGGGGYALALPRDGVDAWRFADLLATRDLRGRRAIPHLAAALAMWQGEAFADVAGHPDVLPAAANLEDQRRRAVEELAWAHLEAGDPDAALAVIEPLLVADPYRERARVAELRSLYAAGRATEALARYQEHRRRLADELGVDPSPLLREVEHDILDHRLPLAPVAPVGPCPLDEALPALPVSSFVGRDHELAALGDLLGRARVVTIVGPGGAGKTRLALHAAHAVRQRYPDGVWWCDLASASPGDVAPVVAARLGVQERAGQDQRMRLAEFLTGRAALVVLDNCEHLVGEVAELIDTLARRSTALDVLVTSRQPVGADGEHRLRLGPLPLPRDDDGSAPAVELFLDRARAASPGFEARGSARSTVVELCRRVGGLPLAVELAAACVTRMDLRALAERIGDQLRLLDRAGGSADRHRSLEGVLESSYRLLDDDESRLLDRLSVFAGPFSLDDADAIGEPDHDRAAGRALGGLVDKSMVTFRASEGRYELLPPVQALGRRHLDARGERRRWRSRHASLVLDRVARTDRTLRSPDEPQVCSVVDATVAELRTARSWLVESGDVDRLLGLCGDLHWFAMLRNRSELTRWADEAARAVADLPSHPALDRVRAAAAVGATKRGDLVDARAFVEGSGGRDVPGRFCVELLGQVNLFDGRLEEAMACARAAAQLHAEAGDELFAVNAATVEAVALAYAGDPSEAQRLARDLVRRADRVGVPSLRAMTRYILGEAVTDPIGAASIYRECLTFAGPVGADFVTGLAATSLAARELRTGDTGRARQRLAEVIDHWQRAGVRNQQWVAIRLLIEVLDRGREHEAVATLAGAYAASAHAGPAYGDDATRLEAALERARRGLGTERFAVAHARGVTCTDERAAVLAGLLARSAALDVQRVLGAATA